MRNFSIFLFLALATLGCKKQNASDAAETVQVTVELDGCAAIDSIGQFSSICFEQLNDSRCPANAACVWKGIAVVKLLFRVNNVQHNVTLSTDKIPGFPSPDTTVSGHSLKLLNVTPYPGTGSSDPVRAVLSVSR